MHNKNKSPEELALFSTADTLRTFCNHTRLIMGLEDQQVVAKQDCQLTQVKATGNTKKLLGLFVTSRLHLVKQGITFVKRVGWQHG